MNKSSPISIGEPAILLAPADQSGPMGSKITFAVIAGGTKTFGYQWQFNGEDMLDTSRITGSRNTNLTISALQPGDLGNYRVIVTNAYGTVTSAVAKLGTRASWATGAKFTDVSAGYAHTVAVQSDGTLWAWGYNYYAQLGDGTKVDKGSPVQIGTRTDWRAVSAGYYHTMALTAQGTLWAWGNNEDGQLGTALPWDRGTWPPPPPPPSPDPTKAAQVGTDSDWLSVSPGSRHTLALKKDGSLWAWGYNNSGQLGNGTSGYSAGTNGPLKIGTASWRTVSAGRDHSVAAKSDGTLWAWGHNWYGQVGDGTLVNKSSPVRIGTASDWKAAFAGEYHTLGIKNDGSLWGWGKCAYAIDSSVPVRIGTDSNWQALASSRFELPYSLWSANLGLKGDGTLWAFGSNNGQFGDGGYYGGTATPVQIGSASDWAIVSVGGSHTVALKTDGTLWAWGDNSYGQLGNGTILSTTSPGVLGPPLVLSLTQNQIGAVGSTSSLGVTATGSQPISYRWQRDGTNLEPDLRTAGVESANLTISSLQLSDAGPYRVIVTNAYGSVTSSVATLNVVVPDRIETTRLGANGQLRMTIVGAEGGTFALQGSPDLFHWANLGEYTNYTGTLILTNLPPVGRDKYFYRTLARPAKDLPGLAVPTLSGTALMSDGRVRFQLYSPTATVWCLQGSPDLIHWGSYRLLTNETGLLSVTNASVAKYNVYFYRVAQP